MLEVSVCIWIRRLCVPGGRWPSEYFLGFRRHLTPPYRRCTWHRSWTATRNCWIHDHKANYRRQEDAHHSDIQQEAAERRRTQAGEAAGILLPAAFIGTWRLLLRSGSAFKGWVEAASAVNGFGAGGLSSLPTQLLTTHSSTETGVRRLELLIERRWRVDRDTLWVWLKNEPGFTSSLKTWAHLYVRGYGVPPDTHYLSSEDRCDSPTWSLPIAAIVRKRNSLYRLLLDTHTERYGIGYLTMWQNVFI